MAGWRPPGPPGDPHKGLSDRNRRNTDGGPSGVQRSYASQLKEREPLFTTYEHLAGLQSGDAALTMLRKVASAVKPIMQKRGWRVEVLAEFLPPEPNLLGLNINKGNKICIRLRYHNNTDLFLPFEQIVDTMLHELTHNVWGDHDSNFHKLWDELRDEHEVLLRKGYTGEGFLGSGKRLGGTFGGMLAPSPHEMRRLARVQAEKRKQQGTLSAGSGQRLGGTPLHAGRDVRQVIADQAARRNKVNKGCGSNRKDADQLSQQASNNTFKTQADEDDANNRAISQALFELMEEEEEQKLLGTFQGISSNGGLGWSRERGLYEADTAPSSSRPQPDHPSEEDQLKWAMEESIRARTSAVESSSSSRPNSSRAADNANIGDMRRKRLPSNQASSSAKPPTKQAPIDLTSSVSSAKPSSPKIDPTAASEQWVCEICTLVNPLQYLSCDACGVERPHSMLINSKQSKANAKPSREPKPTSKPFNELSARGGFQTKAPDPNATLGWSCTFCGSFMEHKWWSCTRCGQVKTSS